jgi:MFS family permease
VDFGITNSTVAAFTVSIFLLGFAIGPMVIAPLSELYGRLWLYHVCNVCFLAFGIGCAVAPNLGSFLALRFLAGCAGAAPMTIGAGTIADVVPVEKRAAAMSMFTIGPLLGPVCLLILDPFRDRSEACNGQISWPKKLLITFFFLL